MKVALALFGTKKGENYQKMGACEVLRVTMPLYQLEKKYSKWGSAWMHVFDNPVELIAASISMSDIIVLPRWWVEQEDLDKLMTWIDIIKTAGKVAVYEADDDYTNQYRIVHPGGDSSVQIAKMCNAITVSTPHLGEVMEKATGLPTYVLPNSIDFRHWEAFDVVNMPEELVGKTVVGIAGTKTHYGDWIVLRDIMRGILDDYPDIVFLIGHFQPDYFDSLPEDRVFRHAGYPYNDYPGLVRMMDISLAPVNADDGFNLSKSGIKAIEAMASKRKVNDNQYGGALSIASDISIYQRVITNKENGLLAEHTPDGWDRAIRWALDHPEERVKMQIAGRKWVRKHRDINKTVISWNKAYTEILGVQ